MRPEYGKYARMVLVLGRQQCMADSLELPGKFIHAYSSLIPQNVRLQLPNGRQFHVFFNRKNNCLTHVGLFLKEFAKSLDCNLVFSYKGDGKFLVYVLNDRGSEVEYCNSRTIARGPIYRRDKVLGIGWSFLVFGVPGQSKSGEISVPSSFLRRFIDIIPDVLSFHVRNMETFKGCFSKSDGVLYVMEHIIANRYFKKDDIILCTYRGSSTFDLVSFDSSRLEKWFFDEDNNIGKEARILPSPKQRMLSGSSNVTVSFRSKECGNVSVEIWPQLLFLFKKDECSGERMELPKKFVIKYGVKLPNQLILQLPNGHKYDANYLNDNGSLSNPIALVDDFIKGTTMALILSYAGGGVFHVAVLNEMRVENIYSSFFGIPEGGPKLQETIGGKGWSFYQLANRRVMERGNIDVPKDFIDRFTDRIPLHVTLKLVTGKTFDAFYVPNRMRKMILRKN